MKKIIFFLSILTITLSSCVKKKLDMEIVNPNCKGFKIKDIQYQFISDPTCDTSQNFGTLSLSGRIDGDIECLYYMIVEIHFYDVNGNELIPLSERYLKISKNDIAITNKSFAVKINYTFARVDYSKINYIHLDYHTEDEVGGTSNKLSLRANPSCLTSAIPTTFDKTIIISDTVKYITVNFGDHASQDGDLISVNVNGKWVLENIYLTNQGTNYSVPVVNGVNWFVIYALNQGTSGPNTVTVTIHTNTQDLNFSFDLLTGESRGFKLIIQ